MIEQQEKNTEEVTQSPIVANDTHNESVNPNASSEGQNNRPETFNNVNRNRQPFNRNNKSNRDNRFNRDEQQYEEKVVTINRVTKVTKGGRHFRFAAVVVIGDKKGKVGFGTGKANEVPDAIKKAIKEAKKSLVTVPLVGTTVPHEVIGHFGSGRVLIKPARKGTGVIAGGPVRAVIELSGLADVYTKSLGTNTPINMIRATISGLQNLRTVKQIAYLRDKNIEDLHK